MEELRAAKRMNIFQNCKDISDICPFYQPKNLFLKPVATLNISVQFPNLRMSGYSISSKILMESLKNWIAPDSFCSLKIIQSTVELIRFEGEIENRSKLQSVLNRLDGKSVKMSSFPEQLKVRAGVAKYNFPSKHDCDSFFRDAKNMNEMKPGERPDTLYISELPTKWFSSKSNPEIPNEHILWKAFQQFGEIQAIDIPSLDPYRNDLKVDNFGLKTFSFNQESTFEAYIQFKNFMGFLKAMDTLRGMKLLKKEGEKAFVANIKVDFDKTKHMSENSIRKRRFEREKLIAKEKEREEIENRLQEEKAILKLKERKIKIEGEAKSKHWKELEEQKKSKILRKLQKEESREVSKKIAAEEKLLLIAQRKLESIRLLSEILKKLKENKKKELEKKKENEASNSQNTHQHPGRNKNYIQGIRRKGPESKQEQKLKSIAATAKDREKGSYKYRERTTKDGRIAKDNFSDTSIEHYEHYREPLGVQGSTKQDGRKFIREDHWRGRGQQQRWKASARDQNISRKKNSFHNTRQVKSRISYVGTHHMLFDVSQNMYYKYFRSISKTSHPQTKNREENLRSQSEVDSEKDRKRIYRNSHPKNVKKIPSKTKSRSRSSSGCRYSSQTCSKSRACLKKDEIIQSHKPRSACPEEIIKKKESRKRTRWEDKPNVVSKISLINELSAERCSSIHTWSRSPSKDRELSWERTCEAPIDHEDKERNKRKRDLEKVKKY